MEDCSDKIIDVKAYTNKDIIVEVDGRVNAQTAQHCKKCGADALVAGSYVFSSDDMKEAIASLR